MDNKLILSNLRDSWLTLYDAYENIDDENLKAKAFDISLQISNLILSITNLEDKKL